MCVLSPHLPVIMNKHYEPLYVTFFGWVINGLNCLYFIHGGGLQACWRPLMELSEFNYLRRVLTLSYHNWPEVVGNLRKAQKRWEWMSRIIGWEGENP